MTNGTAMARSLSILNPQPQRLRGPNLLHQLVGYDNDGDNIAIDYEDFRGARQSLTYAELRSRSSTLAGRLRAVQSEKSSPTPARFIVPVLIPQSLELYITQLAILKAGGAFCPITLDVPEERLRFILQDVEASVLATTASVRQNLPLLDGVHIVAVDDDASSGNAVLPWTNISPSDPAYIMYTSGSTGQPKGVIISHDAATQAFLAHDRHIPTFSRFLQFASPTFDVSVFEIFFPLFRGSTLVCCDRRKLLSNLPHIMHSLDIDAAELTPSVVSSLLQGRQSVPSLKVLLTIGEMLKKSVVEEFGRDANDQSLLYGMYGPTEATIHCTLQPCFAKDMPVGSIGVPLDTVSAFILRPPRDEGSNDSNTDILPLGEEGELAVGGHQLADGYLNREEQTRAVFVQHPEYGRLYRTGDKARLLPDGKLECLGRMSSGQIKLRGQVSQCSKFCHSTITDRLQAHRTW